MHFSKTILLFAGSAAAIPMFNHLDARTAVSTPAVAKAASTPAASSNQVKTEVMSIIPAGSGASTSSQANTASTSSNQVKAAAVSVTPTTSSATTSASGICNDLTSFDQAVKSVLTAVNNFVGGSNIQAQGNQITATGTAWQSASAQLLSDVQALSKQGSGQFSSSDSSKVANYVSATVAPDLISLYKAVGNRKAIFVQVSELQHVHDTLVKVGMELKQICDGLNLFINSQDSAKMQAAGVALTNAWNTVVAQYTSA